MLGMDLSNRRILLTGAVLIVGVLSILMVSGLSAEKSDGACYTKAEYCVGLPVGECLGVEKTSFEYESAEECAELENITRECKTIRGAICGAEQVEDERWPGDAETHGKSCETWRDQYDLDIPDSC